MSRARLAASAERPLIFWRLRAPGSRSPTFVRMRFETAVAAMGSADAFPVRLDLADPASIAARRSQRPRLRLGRLDGLVNCAAIVVHADPLDTSWADWEKIFRVNLFGAYEASRLVAKSMIGSGARGAIVSVASEAGKKGHMESLAYSASKAALINMTRVLSAVLAPHDINVNCVCPGGVATDMLREVSVAYGKLVAAHARRGLFPAHQFAAAAAHRTHRGCADDLLPLERRRRYHSRPSHQRGRRRHAILGESEHMGRRRDRAQPRAPRLEVARFSPKYSLEDDQP